MERITHHTRSISLPSISHSLTLRVEEHLCRLKSSDLASTSSSISHNLASLRDLYKSVDDLLQSVSSKPHQKLVDRVLDGSVRLMDVCGTARDTFSQMKQSVQDLHSSLRRRSTTDSNTTKEISSYMASGKMGDKLIRKCLQDIKKMDQRSAPLNEDDHIVRILNEVETITLAVLRTLLSSVSSVKLRSESSNWSFISKLKLSKHITQRAEASKDTTNEMAIVNFMLKALISSKEIQDINDVKKPLDALEISIQGFEEGLEHLFRCLIKTRVSFLNIFTQ